MLSTRSPTELHPRGRGAPGACRPELIQSRVLGRGASPNPEVCAHRTSQGRPERRECAPRSALPIPDCLPPSSRRQERGTRVGPRVLASQKRPAPPTQLLAPPKVVRGAGGAKTRPPSAAEPRDRTDLTRGPGPETSRTRVSQRPLWRPAWGTRPRPVRAAARLRKTVAARRTTATDADAPVATAPVSDRAACARGEAQRRWERRPRHRPAEVIRPRGAKSPLPTSRQDWMQL